MLRSYVTKKHLTFYFLAIVITWLEAIITPALIQYIVASFTNRQLHLLWQILLWGIGGNLVLVLGLVGKQLYRADRHYRILARFYSRFHRICPLDQFLSGVIVYHLLLGTSFVQRTGFEAFGQDCGAKIPSKSELYRPCQQYDCRCCSYSSLSGPEFVFQEIF